MNTLKADCVCVCVCQCIPAETGCNATKTNSFYISFYSHVLLDFDSWICKLALFSIWLVLFTVKAVAVSSEPFLASSALFKL